MAKKKNRSSRGGKNSRNVAVQGRYTRQQHLASKSYGGGYAASSTQEEKQKLPTILRIIGIVLLILALVIEIPTAVPALFGNQVYNVTDDSMTPEIPSGSAAYIKEVVSHELKANDIIAIQQDDTVTLRRVDENNVGEQYLLVSMDADGNAAQTKILYSDVLGKVGSHYNSLGNIIAFFHSTGGIILLLVLAGGGVLLIYLSSRFRK